MSNLIGHSTKMGWGMLRQSPEEQQPALQGLQLGPGGAVSQGPTQQHHHLKAAVTSFGPADLKHPESAPFHCRTSLDNALGQCS